MPKLLAYVHSCATQARAILRYWEDQQQWLQLELDSPAWFEWLAQERSFRYTYWLRAYQEGVNFTVRAEKRCQRIFWQGWKTSAGQTIKKYLGSSSKLTQAKLDEVGLWFIQQVTAKSDRNQIERLYATTTDLIWLVERLLEGCVQPQLTQQAAQELLRLKREGDEIDQRFW